MRGFTREERTEISYLMESGSSVEEIAEALNTEVHRIKKSISCGVGRSTTQRQPKSGQAKPRQKPVPVLTPEQKAIALRHPGWAWMAGELAKDGTEVVDRYLAITANPCPTSAHTKGVRKS